MAELIPHLRQKDQEIITTYLRHHLPFFVEGSPGIGKSLAVSYWGRRIYREQCAAAGDDGEPLKIDITEDTEVRHLLGESDFVRYFLEARAGAARPLADYFRTGPLVEAIRTGRLLIVEELDRAGRETLFPVLFDAIERKRTYVPELGRTFPDPASPQEAQAAATFNIVITVNRFTDVGTVRLPQALLRRLRRVGLYDPSEEGYDLPDGGAPAAAVPADRQQRRDFAFQFERALVFNNLAYETGVCLAAEEEAEEALRRALGAPTLQRAEAMLELVYALRGHLRASQGDLGGERITPSEASRFICDVLLYGRDGLLSADPKVRRNTLHRHIGALAKDQAHAEEIAKLFDRRYTDRQPPFEPEQA
ncbi:MAG TPA: AAA family ATPase [Anaerolineae bacterium]|nr:AAA family ATPase [Anaerolineae bacterium]HPL30468.1 AAA family ATPase [Anaerolineae bacterium]